MRQLASTRAIPATLAALAILVAGLLIVLPPEETLGNIIRIIFLHGAIARSGLVVFAAAGVLGIAYLVWKKPALAAWCLAAQKTAVVVWVAYALSAVASAYLAWGAAIVWGEPRVRAGAQALGLCVLFLLLTLWVDDDRFTAVVNVLAGVLVWVSMASVVNIWHPLDPVGSSDSLVFKLVFAATLGAVLLMAVQVARWLRKEAV